MSQKADARHEATASRVAALESQLDDYRRIVDKVQTRREGLLRKRTPSRLVKQTWHVMLPPSVGGALLHGDRDGAGEKALAPDARATAEAIKVDVLLARVRTQRTTTSASRPRSTGGGHDQWPAAAVHESADLRAAEHRVADQAR